MAEKPLDPNDPKVKTLLEKMENNPNIDKVIKRLDSSASLDKFRADYHAGEGTPLTCPLCSHFTKVGRLYRSLEVPGAFICNTCFTLIKIEGVLSSIDRIIEDIKAERKTARQARKSEAHDFMVSRGSHKDMPTSGYHKEG
jgi:hypothetical protein